MGMARAAADARENTIHSLLQCETCGNRTICRKSDVEAIFINVEERSWGVKKGEFFQITEIYLSRLKHIVAKFQGFTYYIKAIVIEYVREIDRRELL